MYWSGFKYTVINLSFLYLEFFVVCSCCLFLLLSNNPVLPCLSSHLVFHFSVRLFSGIPWSLLLLFGICCLFRWNTYLEQHLFYIHMCHKILCINFLPCSKPHCISSVATLHLILSAVRSKWLAVSHLPTVFSYVTMLDKDMNSSNIAIQYSLGKPCIFPLVLAQLVASRSTN